MRRQPLALLVLLLAYGCSRFGVEEEDPPPPDDMEDAGPPKARDSGRDARIEEASAADAGVTPPADMVTIAAATPFFIDRHEATAAEWDALTTSTSWTSGVIQTGLPAACKRTDKPGWTTRDDEHCYIDDNEGYGLTHGEEPVNCVDWCDAVAFCLAKGKRLCGKVGGGPVDPRSTATALKDEAITNVSQWSVACGGEQVQAFPYGADFKEGQCNFSGDPKPASSSPSCAGSVPGLLDMAGNLNEWEDACLDDALNCIVRGGAYRSPPDDDGCKAGHVVPRQGTYDDVGFRCCADLPK